jgi:hypothetical protein
MDLDKYKMWYVHDEGHWYVSKVKQFNPSSIQQFAKVLKLINSIFGSSPGELYWDQYNEFKPTDKTTDTRKDKHIFLNDHSILFVCIHFLNEDLLDSSHLESTNIKKFKIFNEIQKDFLEGKDYDFFITKYKLKFLKNDLMIYYRNFKSWLGKFGFYGEYESKKDKNNKTIFITDVGKEFLNNSEDIEIANAIFLNQIKKFQLWNPTIDSKYMDYKIRPYYLLLEILTRVDNYFSKAEYVLFITKIKSHKEVEVENAVNLIKDFRTLEPDEQKDYIQEILDMDKKKFKKRKRTNYERLLDSAPKEIACYGYGGLIEQGTGRFVGNFVITDLSKARKELENFRVGTQFIEFKNDKLAWISHLGSLDGMSLESIIEMYLDSGMSIDTIKIQLGSKSDLAASIEDKIYEKEIEEFYIKNIELIDPDLEVILKPSYGRQFSTHIGPIDILCINKITNEYVICELKRGQTSDETVGQLLRYMGWVYEHLANFESNVKGILVGSDFDKKIDYALLGVQDDKIYNLIKKFNHPFSSSNRPLIKADNSVQAP